MNTKKAFTGRYLYPLLFGLYPVLAFLAANLEQIRWMVAVRTLIVSALAGVLVYALLRWLLKDWGRAAILSTLLFILFYSYGHIYGMIEGKALLGFSVGRHLVLAPLWLLLGAAGVWWILRRPLIPAAVHRLFTVVGVALVVFPLLQVGSLEARMLRGTPSASAAPDGAAAQLADENSPDIYYIILDGYTREDVLRTDYQYDNSAFTSQLKALGFVLPDCAQSNYSRTAFSISSALHMNYVDTFSDQIRLGEEKIDFVAFQDYIQHSPVRTKLEQMGYQTVGFETGFWWNELTDADVYVVGNDNPLEKYQQGYEINQFEVMFLRTTALRVFSEMQTAYFAPLTRRVIAPEQRHYERILYNFDQLEKLPKMPGKKFVYAHFVAPHAPFVFDRQGEYKLTFQQIPGYTDEIDYLNKRVLQAVETLQRDSRVPPVIIIQGDHGWDESSRMKILNAYYLPNGGSKQVYPTITPVNTFRMIFNTYFDGDYELLKDVSYFSSHEHVYDFSVAPSTCMENKGK